MRVRRVSSSVNVLGVLSFVEFLVSGYIRKTGEKNPDYGPLRIRCRACFFPVHVRSMNDIRRRHMKLLKWIETTWCELCHPTPRWPISGYSECPKCLRKRRVEWEPVPAKQA